MKVSFEASFARDLRGIRDKALLKRVEQVIAEVKTATALSEIKSLIKMRGYATFSSGCCIGGTFTGTFRETGL